MSSSKPQSASIQFVRALTGLLPLAISLAILVFGFFFVRDLQANNKDVPQMMIVLIAIVWGVGGVVLLFTTANFFVDQLPEKWTQRLQPFIFIGPALLMLTWALVLPTFRTIIASFFNESGAKFVGLKNFVYVFTNPAMLTVFRNNLLWIVFGTSFTVTAGLLVAVLADRSRFETAAKTLIFLPMAISFVGAGVIWNFIYAVKQVWAGSHRHGQRFLLPGTTSS
jgi:alpha-glucoside transport system permease protein